jgi:hypothetical protein
MLVQVDIGDLIISWIEINSYPYYLYYGITY